MFKTFNNWDRQWVEIEAINVLIYWVCQVINFFLSCSYENLWSRNIEQLHLFSKFGLSIDIRFSGFMPADSEQVWFLSLSIAVSYNFFSAFNQILPNHHFFFLRTWNDAHWEFLPKFLPLQYYTPRRMSWVPMSRETDKLKGL